MSELSPPDEPLDDVTRARIRERVVSGRAAVDGRSPRRGWLVPVAASVAVGAVVTGAVLLGGNGEDRDAVPAGPGSPSEATSTTVPTTAPASVPTPDSDSGCARETRRVLPGAEPVASTEDPTGTTTFYVSGPRYTLCHDGGSGPTVHHAKPLAGGGDYNPYEFSTELPEGDQALIVAGGPVPGSRPDGSDFAVTYTFPDGHVATSTVVGDPAGDLWWLVTYLAPDWAAAFDGAPRVDVRGGPPAEPLDVLDHCAQVNHGC